jgi:hypothetical protein
VREAQNMFYKTYLRVCARMRPQPNREVHSAREDHGQAARDWAEGSGEWYKQHRLDPVSKQQRTLNAKLRGHYQHYGRRPNYPAMGRSIRESVESGGNGWAAEQVESR